MFSSEFVTAALALTGVALTLGANNWRERRKMEHERELRALELRHQDERQARELRFDVYRKLTKSYGTFLSQVDGLQDNINPALVEQKKKALDVVRDCLIDTLREVELIGGKDVPAHSRQLIFVLLTTSTTPTLLHSDLDMNPVGIAYDALLKQLRMELGLNEGGIDQ